MVGMTSLTSVAFMGGTRELMGGKSAAAMMAGVRRCGSRWGFSGRRALTRQPQSSASGDAIDRGCQNPSTGHLYDCAWL